MSANAFPTFNHQFLLDDGTVAAGAWLYTCISGTTTLKTTYTDAAGTVANANPIILSQSGRCTLFAATDAAYTLVLMPANVALGSGTPIKTWDSVLATPDPAGTGYLPLAGGTMTGLITLSGDATAALNPVSKQQLDAAITASAASVAASVATATAAAAAATAAVAAFQPASFRLASANGSAVSRTVTLAAGTWQVILDSRIHYNEGANYDITATQSATVGTTTVNTSIHIGRSGGSGYGRDIHGTSLAVGTLTVAASASFTMSIAAISAGAASGSGSILTLEKTA